MFAFRWFLLRDVSVAAVAIASGLADGELRRQAGASAWAGEGVVGVGVALVAGLSLFLVIFAVHEWGHLTGARLTGARVYPGRSLLSPFMFLFDSNLNDRRQFLTMSYGGYLGTALGLPLLFAVSSWSALSGWIALGGGLIGVAATLIAELPETLKVHRGGALPESEFYLTNDHPEAGVLRASFP